MLDGPLRFFRLAFAGRRGIAKRRRGRLLARAEKLLDGSQNRLAIRNPAGDDVVLLLQQLRDVLEELAAAVGAFDLAVAEQVQLRDQRFLQELDAVRAVVTPV